MTAVEALALIPYAGFLKARMDGDVCVMPFHQDLVGNAALPALHGGVVGAFLELTALVQVVALADSDRIPKPIGFTIDYLRSAGPRDTRARAEVVKHGRRIMNVRVLAWQDDPAKPVAAGVGNFLL